MYDLSTTLNLTLSNITQATSLAIKLFLGKPVRIIHVPLSQITPYVAPIKEKLLLHAVHAVVEEKYTHSSSTVVSLVFSLLSVLCSLPWKHSMQSTHNLDRKND